MQRRSFLSLSGAAALAHTGPAATPVAAARVYPLDGEWSVRFGAETRTVRVPGAAQEAFPACHGIFVYECSFPAPAHPERDGRYLLRFHAADYLAEVELNGAAVGAHEGGETPFELDVTAHIKPGAANRLGVRVLNPGGEPVNGIVLKETPHRNKEVPYRPGASFNVGGLTESVELVLAPPVRITDLVVRPDWQSGTVQLEATLFNATARGVEEAVEFLVLPAQAALVRRPRLAPGANTVTAELHVPGHRLWSLEDPALYTVLLRAGADSASARFGFRDFRVRDGWFHLNGRRLFLKSTHTGNHAPVGQIVAPPQAPDLLRRDLLYLKSSGFNTVRFIAGLSHPDQLDLADEIGLMVYEECLAGWCLDDSPHMAERFERSVLEMIRRDRNHPSVTLWGLLNETKDGPVFRKAVATLGAVRRLDPTRLVLLGSGRWDCQWNIGSVSNPGSGVWEHTWGAESPTAAPLVSKGHPFAGGYEQGAGDAHVYPRVPQTGQVNTFLRTLGTGTRPVFLSEYGIGSLFDATGATRQYEQARANPALEDFALARGWSERFAADWRRFGMEGTCAFPEDLFGESFARMARHRALGFNLVRSNPQLCGFNVTGMLDHAMTGEGFWDFWRNWKPGSLDVLQDGWAPLRWCLFANPTHAFTGRPVRIEAVLATEDALAPGAYPARFRILGPSGIAWERAATVRIPEPRPLAVPVLAEDVAFPEPGSYRLVATLEHGGAPRARECEFHVSAPVAGTAAAALEGFDEAARAALASAGVRHDAAARTILAGPAADWPSIQARVAQGATAVFVDAPSFAKLPFAKLGRCYNTRDWLYHKECVAKRHPVFDGLPAPGIFDWDYYGQIVPAYTIDPQQDPDEVAAASFATGTTDTVGYRSGVLVAAWREGQGRLVFSTLRILENLAVNPAAARLLHNLLRHCTA
jgi:hypothetical protein